MPFARPASMLPDGLSLAGMPGHRWRPDMRTLATHFFAEGRLATPDAVEICHQAADAFRSEANVLELEGPMRGA